MSSSCKIFSQVVIKGRGPRVGGAIPGLVVLGSIKSKLSSQHLGGRGRRISEFKASLVYKGSSRTARTIQRNPVLKNKNKQKKY